MRDNNLLLEHSEMSFNFFFGRLLNFEHLVARYQVVHWVSITVLWRGILCYSLIPLFSQFDELFEVVSDDLTLDGILEDLIVIDMLDRL